MEEKNPQQADGHWNEAQSAPPQNDAGNFSRSKTFPTVGDMLAIFGIVLAAQVVVAVSGFIAMLFMGIKVEALMGDDVFKGRFMAIFYFVAMSLALAGIIFYRNYRGGRGPIARFSPRGLNPVLLIWGFVLMMAVNVVIDPVTSLLPDPPYEEMGRGFWTVVSVTVFAPLFEEAIFRGVFLESLRAKYGVVTAVVVSSLFFGLVHLNPAQVVGAGILGLVFGYIYVVTRSLWAPIILHAANNAIAYTMLRSSYQDKDLSDLVGQQMYMVIFILALVVVAVSAYMIRKSLERIKEEEKNSAGA